MTRVWHTSQTQIILDANHLKCGDVGEAQQIKHIIGPQQTSYTTACHMAYCTTNNIA